MVQGTTSDAGKSTLVTALCRWLYRQGSKVAPFKPQNMALNSMVTVDGGEIGRAQAVQAQASGLHPHSDMNPVLLKPNTDIGAQVIIHGKPVGNMEAVGFHAYKETAMDAVMASYQRLSEKFDVIVVEGAGSPAEINIRENDIANMGFASQVGCPVILIADIDRGGVFAHLVGTLALLSEHERELIKGFVINRFRGDISLLQSGLDWLEAYTGKPVLGVLPYLHDLHLQAEDAIVSSQTVATHDALRVVVPVLPRISNHTDFDPLRLHPQVDLQFIGSEQAIPESDLVIIPGTKSVIADRHWLKEQGWDTYIRRHLRYGGRVMGICGGYQILGTSISDPRGHEGLAGTFSGLDLLDAHTTLHEHKQLRRVTGVLAAQQSPVEGYEIHTGVTVCDSLLQHFAELDGRKDGAISDDGRIIGTYIHGVFDRSEACHALLTWAGLSDPVRVDSHAQHEENIERLASLLDTSLDMQRLQSLIT